VFYIMRISTLYQFGTFILDQLLKELGIN